LSKLKRQPDETSGVENWRLHDLRRTCRTGLSKLGVRRGATGLVANYETYDYQDEALAALRLAYL
jgi:hypothetical protein